MLHNHYGLILQAMAIEREYIEEFQRLLANKKLFSVFSGLYRSQITGSGLEFETLRRYVPGDPIRYIDWRAYARTEKLFLKVFKEYKNAKVLFIADIYSSVYKGHEPFELTKQMFYTMELFAIAGIRTKDLLAVFFTDNKILDLGQFVIAPVFIQRIREYALKSLSVYPYKYDENLLNYFKNNCNNKKLNKHKLYCLTKLWLKLALFNNTPNIKENKLEKILYKVPNVLKTSGVIVVLNSSLLHINQELEKLLKILNRRHLIVWINFLEGFKAEKNNGVLQIPYLYVNEFGVPGLVDRAYSEKTVIVKKRAFRLLEHKLHRLGIKNGTITDKNKLVRDLIWILKK